MDWDVFISHASEDKETVARPLAARLTEAGFRVWLDEAELTLGDSLRRKIDAGLSRSKYGIVVLSPCFFGKEWPQRELNALAAREDDGVKVILPIWHGIDKKAIAAFSPLLADRLAVSTDKGLDNVAAEVTRVLKEGQQTPDTRTDPTTRRRFARARMLGNVRKRHVAVVVGVSLGLTLFLWLWAGGIKQSSLSRNISPVTERYKTAYTLKMLGLTYSGLQVGSVPGLNGRPDCPGDGQAGCIVGYQPLGDDSPREKVPATIRCYTNYGFVYETIADPREFVVPRLQPGLYNIAIEGDALATNYIFSNVTVMARQATLMPIRVRPR